MHPSIQVKFSSYGDADLPVVMASKIGKLSFQLRSFREPLTSAANEISGDIEAQFDEGGAPPWEPLRPSTIKRKNGNSQILIRTGRGKRGVTRKNAWEIDRDEARLTIPDDVYYMGFHQTGFVMAATKPKSNADRDFFGQIKSPSYVPARPFAVVSGPTRKTIGDIFDDWVAMRVLRVMK